MVTPEEKELIHERISKCKFSNFSGYARKMLLNGYIVNIDLSKYHELAGEVNKIGVNINQIAKNANTRGIVFAEEINFTKELMDKIWQLLKSSLSELQSKTR